MTKKIYLGKSKSYYTLVDDEDYDWLNQWKWGHTEGYAYRTIMVFGKKQKVWMHREIMKTPKGLETDHKNLDRLDNRKTNLRICTRSQNQANRELQPNNTSGYKGVSWSKSRNRWIARIQVQRKQYSLGSFVHLSEAIEAYNTKAQELFGEFAVLNK